MEPNPQNFGYFWIQDKLDPRFFFGVCRSFFLLKLKNGHRTATFLHKKKRLGRYLAIFATTIRTNISPTHDVSPKACRLHTIHHNPFLSETIFPNQITFSKHEPIFWGVYMRFECKA